MKHLCVIQLINSSVRSCGRSLQVPVIFQCRKGKNQSTVSELFYHTFATDFIIQGEAIDARQVSVSECSVEWENVGHRHEFAQRDCLLRAYTAREDDILPYIGWVVICPAKLQFVVSFQKTINGDF